MEKARKRFESKYRVDEASGCWLWTGTIMDLGYGVLTVDSVRMRAHRLSYQLHIGPIPKGEGFHGTCVCHKCDVRNCVNPEHLYLGTHQENMRDAEKKGRFSQASRHWNATLKDDDVRLIKRFLERFPAVRGESPSPREFLSRWFGVSGPTISHISTGRKWKRVA